MPALTQILLLLGSAVAIVLAFQRLRIPSSLAYLLIGLLLGPHTAGPVVDALPLQGLAEFGIVRGAAPRAAEPASHAISKERAP